MKTRLTLAFLTILVMAGCGSSTTSPPAPPVPTPTPTLGPLTDAGKLAAVVTGTEEVGAIITQTVQAVAGDSIEPPPRWQGTPPYHGAQSGSCTGNKEIFKPAPGHPNDPNSAEVKAFYQAGCTGLALDTLRLWNISGTSQTNTRRTISYTRPPGKPMRFAEATSSGSIENGTYGKLLGGPYPLNGFAASYKLSLNIFGLATFVRGHEIIQLPGTSTEGSNCGSSAGFNLTGLGATESIYAWQGGDLNPGQQTVASGVTSVSGTSTGSAAYGSAGSFTLNEGTQNTACPLRNLQWTYSGGTPIGGFSFEHTATYKSGTGTLQTLSIDNATFAGGRIALTFTQGSTPSNPIDFTGVFSIGGSDLATFNCDPSGFGTLMTTAGQQYTVVLWQVINNPPNVLGALP